MSLFASFAAWVDHLPWLPLLVVAILMGLAPFFPEPHLLEKLKMLAEGRLVRPLDIFDLCLHATPVLLVLFKLGRHLMNGTAS